MAQLRERPTLWTHLFHLTFYRDYVFYYSVMDLSVYEYSFVSCDDVSLLAPYSPTSQILDIDDEIAQHDSG